MDVSTPDGVRLHVEQVGEGSAVIFVHEFAGDHRSWEPQNAFSRSPHKCVTLRRTRLFPLASSGQLR